MATDIDYIITIIVLYCIANRLVTIDCRHCINRVVLPPYNINIRYWYYWEYGDIGRHWHYGRLYVRFSPFQPNIADITLVIALMVIDIFFFFFDIFDYCRHAIADALRHFCRRFLFFMLISLFACFSPCRLFRRFSPLFSSPFFAMLFAYFFHFFFFAIISQHYHATLSFITPIDISLILYIRQIIISRFDYTVEYYACIVFSFH